MDEISIKIVFPAYRLLLFTLEWRCGCGSAPSGGRRFLQRKFLSIVSNQVRSRRSSNKLAEIRNFLKHRNLFSHIFIMVHSYWKRGILVHRITVHYTLFSLSLFSFFMNPYFITATASLNEDLLIQQRRPSWVHILKCESEKKLCWCGIVV